MKTNRTVLLLFLFALLLYGSFVDLVPLLDPDEPVYGETAKEMLTTGDWLSPRIYGEFWYDKPPLFYWLEAISFSLFGVSTWAARLPSVLLGALLPCYVYLATRGRLGERTALAGSFILASSLEIIILARSSVTDMTLTAALTVALLSFWRREYLPAYMACGLALLAKGPIGFGFPALIVFFWMVCTRTFDWKHIMGLRWYWGIPLACLIGLPWFIAMGWLHGDDFINTFLGYHNITRFAQPEHAGQNHYWLYLVVLAAGFYPWTGMLPGILRRFRYWKSDRDMMFFMVWALFIFIFFSLSSTQLFSYILPLYPPLSIMAGKYITGIAEGRYMPKILFGSYFLFSLLVAAAIWLAPVEPTGGRAVRAALIAVLLCCNAVSLWNIWCRTFRGFLLSQGFLSLVLILSVWSLFAPAVGARFTSEGIARRLAETEIAADKPLYIDSFYRPGIAFYSDIYGRPLPEMDPAKRAEDEEHQKEGVLLPGEETDENLPAHCTVLVQEKVYAKWPAAQQQGFARVWKKDTALLLER